PEPGAEPGVPPSAVGTLALEHRLALLGPELLPGDVERDAVRLREADQLAALPLAGAPVPGPQRPGGDAQRVVGNDLGPVDPEGAAEAATRRTGAHRGLVAEEARPRGLEPTGAGRGHQALPHRPALAGDPEVGVPVSLAPGLLERRRQPGAGLPGEREAVGDHVGLTGGAHRLSGTQLLEGPDLTAEEQPAVAVLQQPGTDVEKGLGVRDADRKGQDRRSAAVLVDQR